MGIVLGAFAGLFLAVALAPAINWWVWRDQISLLRSYEIAWEALMQGIGRD